MTSRQKVSVSIDSSLLAFIDNHTNNRSEVVNEALEQWRKDKLRAEIDEAYARAGSEADPALGEDNWLLNDQALEEDRVD